MTLHLPLVEYDFNILYHKDNTENNNYDDRNDNYEETTTIAKLLTTAITDPVQRQST